MVGGAVTPAWAAGASARAVVVKRPATVLSIVSSPWDVVWRRADRAASQDPLPAQERRAANRSRRSPCGAIVRTAPRSGSWWLQRHSFLRSRRGVWGGWHISPNVAACPRRDSSQTFSPIINGKMSDGTHSQRRRDARGCSGCRDVAESPSPAVSCAAPRTAPSARPAQVRRYACAPTAARPASAVPPWSASP